MAVQTSEPKLKSREDLIIALQFASIVEHSLCCEYLFTGFTIRHSLKDFPTPKDDTKKQQLQYLIDKAKPWQAQIYFIARQEMEHLGIVTNLLSSIGEAPYFKRQQFPQRRESTLLGAPYCLEKFSEIALKTFIWFEKPDYLEDSFPKDYLNRCEEKTRGLAATAYSPSPEHIHKAVEKFDIHSVQQLYEEILNAFQNLPAEELFQGDPQNQLGDVLGYRVQMKSITNRQEAADAINLVLEQGEGIGMQPVDSDAHFQRFTEILSDYKSFKSNPIYPDPAINVVSNPLTQAYQGEFTDLDHCYNCPPHQIHRESALEVMNCFNGCYNLMLEIMYDFFRSYITPAFPHRSQPGSLIAKFYSAFFPLMTMAIRPLGEILVRMSAGKEYPDQYAGPSFEIDNELFEDYSKAELVNWNNDKSTNRRLKAYLKKLKRLSKKAKYLAENAENIISSEDIISVGEFRRRMSFLHENLSSTRLHMRNIWKENY